VTSLPRERVVRELEDVAQVRGDPDVIVCDNGPEFGGEAVDQWADQHGVTLKSSSRESQCKTASSKASTADCGTNF